MQASRITVFAGHYGSGKTTLAIAWALALAGEGKRVLLCDLDIVNPYFRTADAAAQLADAGIGLIASPFAGSNVDAPALPAATQTIFDDAGVHAVIDLGGDDRGALALGRYAPQLREGGECEMLLVLNQYRPLTRSVADLSEIRREIEAAARVPFTGLVNNSNLGAHTTVEAVRATFAFAQEAARALALPLRMTAIDQSLLPLPPPLAAESAARIFPVRRFEKQQWKL